MTDSKMIPEGWVEKKIEQVAEKIAMGPFGSNIKVETFTNEWIPIVSGAHLKWTRLEDKGYNFITTEHAERLRNSKVYRWDVIFTHAWNIGQVAYIPDDSRYKEYIISQRQFYLRCKKSELDPVYITYFFKTQEGQHKLLANANQVWVPSIAQPATYLRQLSIVLPPLHEQQAIARMLSSFDDKIELLRQQNETLEKTTSTLFSEWFGKYRIDDELPEGWRIGRFTEILTIMSWWTPKTSNPDYWNGNVPWLSIADIPDSWAFVTNTEKRITEAWVENSPAKILPAYSTIITARWTVWKVGLLGIPLAINQSCFWLKSKYGLDFHLYLLVKEIVSVLKSRVHWAVFDTITRDTFNTLEIIVPPDNVLLDFERVISPFFMKIKENMIEISILAETRDTLLPRLMEWKMRLDLSSL